MGESSSEKPIQFDIVHNDGWIRVRIVDGFATFTVGKILDDEVVVRAISKAVRLGAVRGAMYTGDVVNDKLAAKHRKRAERGTTWLGGNVTQIEDGEDGPQFRIDWDEMPLITE